MAAVLLLCTYAMWIIMANNGEERVSYKTGIDRTLTSGMNPAIQVNITEPVRFTLDRPLHDKDVVADDFCALSEIISHTADPAAAFSTALPTSVVRTILSDETNKATYAAGVESPSRLMALPGDGVNGESTIGSDAGRSLVAKVRIGIEVIAAVLLLLAGLILFSRQRREGKPKLVREVSGSARGDSSSMRLNNGKLVTLPSLLLCMTTAAVAQDTSTEAEETGHLLIAHPKSNDIVMPDDLVIEWTYDFYYDDYIDMRLEFYDHGDTDYSDEDRVSMFAPATLVSVSIPVTILPSLRPGESTVFDLYVSLSTVPLSTSATAITLSAPYSTTTTTVISTIVQTSTLPIQFTSKSTSTYCYIPDPTETDDGYWHDIYGHTTPLGEEAEEDGGLSSSATAGIAVGAAAGALLFAAGGFIIYRRRKRNKTPRTIREISAGGPASAGFLGGSSQDTVTVGDSTAEQQTTVGLPPIKGNTPVSGTASASGRQSYQRYELGA